MVASANSAAISAEEQVLTVVNNANDLDTSARRAAGVDRPRQRRPGLRDRNGNGRLDPDEAVLGKIHHKDTFRGPATVATPFADWPRRLHYTHSGTVSTTLKVTPYVGLVSMELALDLQVGEMNGIAPAAPRSSTPARCPPRCACSMASPT